MFRLDGRTAIVTGAASGIGAATATMFAEAGADLVLGWFPGDPYDVRPVATAVEERGRRAIVVEVDVTSTADVERLVGTTVAELGRLDVVVANAGIARLVPAEELDDERWRQLMEVDVLGVFRCFRAALPHMRRSGFGRLLATSSIAGAYQGWNEHVHYTTAKAGLVGMMRTLAIDFGRYGITANAVAPGVIVSPQSSDPINSLGPEGLAEFAKRVPVGRNGAPEDIAALFLFLASDAAGYITGQTILVDGGVSLSLT